MTGAVRTRPAGVSIRPAVAADIPRLQEIEVAAGAMFRPLRMDLVADDDPFGHDELLAYADAGRAWVATEDGTVGTDCVVGYLVADVVDGAAHVEQVTVHPDAARRGIGRELVEHLAGWATENGFLSMTLTTFRDVPWNAPYYEQLGFRRIDVLDEGPELQRLRAQEQEHGLDAWPRTSMRRDLQHDTTA